MTYTKSTIVVESMHLLINRCTFRHQEETLITTTLMQDINSLQRHILQTREIESRRLSTSRIVSEISQIVLIHITIQPDGQVRFAEDPQRLTAVPELEERGLVRADVVPGRGELGIVVLSPVAVFAGVELLGAAAEPDVGAFLVRPGVVCYGVERLVD